MKSVDWKQSKIWEWARCGDTQDTALQHTLMLCQRSSLAFGVTFMPDSFTKPMTDDRVKHFALLDDKTIPKKYIRAYRGFMKTTSAWAKMVQQTCYRTVPFSLVVSQSEGYAINITEAVRAVLAVNENIIDMFGDMTPQKTGKASATYSKDAWHAFDWRTGAPYAFFSPRGFEQQISGAWDQMGGVTYRPSFELIDDGENRRTIRNQDQRQHYIEQAEGNLYPCVPDDMPDPDTNRWTPDDDDPLWQPPWGIVYQDTRKHVDAYITRLQKDPTWVGLEINKAKKDGEGVWHSTAPELFSDEQVQKEIQRHTDNGTIKLYALEYLGTDDVKSPGGWDSSSFRYYSEPYGPAAFPFINPQNSPLVDRFVIADPAQTDGVRSCNMGALAFGVNKRDNCIMVRREFNEKIPIDEFFRKMREFCIETNSWEFYLETTGAKGSLLWMARQIINSGIGQHIQVIPIDARKDTPDGDFGEGGDAAKIGRASTLIPYYRRGEVWHEESLRGGFLEVQEKGYPEPGGWDTLDPAGHLTYVMFGMKKILWKPFPIPETDATRLLDQEDPFKAQLDAARSDHWRLVPAW